MSEGTSSSGGMPQHPPGPPYAPQIASLGGVPTIHTDVPITAVFLVIFILGAISHMTILQLNQRRGHKFLMSGMTFGFCMARITTCVMRIVWATRPMNVRIAIAAQVFVAAGVVLLFVINLIFAQRIVRAQHPHSGWHPAFSLFFKASYAIIVVSLFMLIISVIQSFYTLNANTRRIDTAIQDYGRTFYAVISFLPVLIVIAGILIPRKTRVEKFGTGHFRTKIYILTASAVLLCLGASFRAGIGYLPPHPRDDAPRYDSKACFYIFNFAVEVLVVFLYVVLRTDMRFWVPNSSHHAGDYSRKEADSNATSEEGRLRMVNTEEEVFDDLPAPEKKVEKPKDEEARIGSAP